MTNDLQNLQQQAKLPANKVDSKVVAQFFAANKKSMMAVLPKHVSADRMTRIALSALRTTPKLMQCTTESLMGAVLQLSQLGLEPNTMLGHAYLIPFNNRRQNRTDVQVIIGYKGLLDLARRSGQIEELHARAVYENDEFDYAYGLETVLVHRPAMSERGGIVAFYAVARLTGGGSVFEVMSVEAVDKIMQSSQGYKAGKKYNKPSIWETNYEEMGRKTVIRRLFKYLPVSIEIATAGAMQDVADAGGDQHIASALEGEYAVVPRDYEEPEENASTPATVEANTEQNTEAKPETENGDSIEAVKCDSNGEEFDPEHHMGPDVFNKDGSYRKKRVSRAKQKSEDPAPQMDPAPDQGEPAPQQNARVETGGSAAAATAGNTEASGNKEQSDEQLSSAQIMDMVHAAETSEELDKIWKDSTGLPMGQRAEIYDAIESRNL